MRKIFFSIYTFLLPMVAFCQLIGAPIKIDNSLQKIIEKANVRIPEGLPYGDKDLLQQYDNTWKFYSTSKTQNNNNTISLKFDSLISKLDRFFYDDIDGKNRTEGTMSYTNNMFLFAPHFKVANIIKTQNKNVQVKCIKLFDNVSFTTYSITFNGNKDCNNCEYVVKQTQNILVNINKENRIIDKLLIGNIEGNDLGRYRLYFYLDGKKTIHLKDFSSDELEDGFLNYEQYQILPNGIFARYYEKDGFVKSNTEQGIVSNNRREGKWIEKKQNENIDLNKSNKYKDNYSYLEAIYKNGIPIGEWKYYKLLQYYNNIGQPIFASRKKGVLVYKEIFENGKLKQRKF
jgi:hypothetical protein